MPDGLVPSHHSRTYRTDELTLGFKGDRIEFSHRPYHRRSAEARADYDELRLDLTHNGMRNPLITYCGHVLVGQRRYEIMSELGCEEFQCIEIEEDVGAWWRDDIPRLEALKQLCYA